jgi:hypothetical protein
MPITNYTFQSLNPNGLVIGQCTQSTPVVIRHNCYKFLMARQLRREQLLHSPTSFVVAALIISPADRISREELTTVRGMTFQLSSRGQTVGSIVITSPYRSRFSSSVRVKVAIADLSSLLGYSPSAPRGDRGEESRDGMGHLAKTAKK